MCIYGMYVNFLSGIHFGCWSVPMILDDAMLQCSLDCPSNFEES